MSRDDFINVTTSFVFEVQQSIGFDSSASYDLLDKLRVALEPLRLQCRIAREAMEDLERQIGRQLALHADKRTRFLRFDREASGYMTYADFQRALEVLLIPAEPHIIKMLMQKYDTTNQGQLNYTSFLRLANAADAAPPRSEGQDAHYSPLQLSVPDEDDDALELSEQIRTEQLIGSIRAKLYQRGMSTRELFLQLDQGRYSYLTLEELHRGLAAFGIPIHRKELVTLTRHFMQKDETFSLADFARLIDGCDAVRPTRELGVIPPRQSPPPKSRLPHPTTRKTHLDGSLPAIAAAIQAQGKSLRELFDSMAEGHDVPCISPAKFIKQLDRWGVSLNDGDDIVRLVGRFDSAGRGGLVFHEFVKLVQHLQV
ncbi:hypothetical protein Ae201684P_015301 [Aphanomyces euteiches]|uniref:EF-hand domain-containing protein n=1 Tax=Aphanomyces euteiches TaxID=100861 RepID=A0A6G0XFP3_9STRA|nr:hypothetical protein Ae201684_005199 [Aphanomyces euteiches]KAH9053536.1 hypothetical protein Ae201684P_015301 [Aphanomyces euteiches]KAH9131801.1 hypothetical protein AeRB84_021636 [Aphanomyces euteiches]